MDSRGSPSAEVRLRMPREKRNRVCNWNSYREIHPQVLSQRASTPDSNPDVRAPITLSSCGALGLTVHIFRRKRDAALPSTATIREGSSFIATYCIFGYCVAQGPSPYIDSVFVLFLAWSNRERSADHNFT
jgi:hypothetical protein